MHDQPDGDMTNVLTSGEGTRNDSSRRGISTVATLIGAFRKKLKIAALRQIFNRPVWPQLQFGLTTNDEMTGPGLRKRSEECSWFGDWPSYKWEKR